MARKTMLKAASRLALALVAAPVAMPLAAQSTEPETNDDAKQEWTKSEEWQAAAAKALQTVDQMEDTERVVVTRGYRAIPFPGSIPEEAIPGAGYIPGIERLGIPPLHETDGPLGVTYIAGLRNDFATPFPSSVSQGASFDPALIERMGEIIGSEARAKGFDILLAGGANLTRDPRNGRTFEYFSEDPLLTGKLTGASVRGIQSNDIISTVKHFALNGQETGRRFIDVQIGRDAARESDLLAFEIALEIGEPGAVMCAYNKVNGQNACANEYLLTDVLRDSWGYPGFVMSDWGAVPSLQAALAGLDQQSAASLDNEVYFQDQLLARAEADQIWDERLDAMNRRILTSVYRFGLDEVPADPGGEIDYDSHADFAQEVATAGMVLLRNEGDIPPLSEPPKRILVVGGYADAGVLSGAGSSQAHGEGGPAIIRPYGDIGPYSRVLTQQYHRSSPLKALRARYPDARIDFRDGRYVSDAVALAQVADLVVVFATQWMSEGFDLPDLSLPDGQDALIAAVSAANPRTVVVLETGGPIVMPWLDDTAAVLQAWYPGIRGGQAIADVLSGDAYPGGRLPLSFPRSTQDLPRPDVPGALELGLDFTGSEPSPGYELVADYDVEGADIGYRWLARNELDSLFPFGFGLNYTEFSFDEFALEGVRASVRVTNTGERPGAAVPQLYLLSRNGQPMRRLVGFAKTELPAGEARTLDFDLDRRLLADNRDGYWIMPEGDYEIGLGTDAETIVARKNVRLPARRWRNGG